MEFSRQECWSGLPLPGSPEPGSSALAGRLFTIWANPLWVHSREKNEMPYFCFLQNLSLYLNPCKVTCLPSSHLLAINSPLPPNLASKGLWSTLCPSFTKIWTHIPFLNFPWQTETGWIFFLKGFHEIKRSYRRNKIQEAKHKPI